MLLVLRRVDAGGVRVLVASLSSGTIIVPRRDRRGGRPGTPGSEELTPRGVVIVNPPVNPPGTPSSPRPLPRTIATMGEFALIEKLTGGGAEFGQVLLGPGDDAAVLAAPDGRVVVSTDVLVDGVHFRTDWASGEQIGRRAALATLADIAAMGAVPTGLVVGLAAPPGTSTDLVLAIGQGLRTAAAEVGAAVVGGDLTRSDVLTLAVTVLGDLQGRDPVRRSGARAGDLVALTGRLGWAAAGLTVLSRGFRSPAAMVNAYRAPEPPLAAGPVAAAAGASSMIDISDGLLADLGHVALASGVRIDLTAAALPVTPRLAEVAAALGRDPLIWVLTGGDDHALVATFGPDAALPPGWDVIGRVHAMPPVQQESGERVGAAPNAAAVTVDGSARDGVHGWDHFAG